MNFTLFIDESGDFETQRGEWVIAGVLFAESVEIVNKKLNTKLSNLPNQLGLKSIKDFHLTDFRRESSFGHAKAVENAEALLASVAKCGIPSYYLAVINFAKHALSDRERTYRAMLADLLSLCDTVIPEDQEITSLDLIVATRTIDGELQTTIRDLNTDVVNSLPDALDYDLASMGLVNILGKNLRVKQDYANNLWGLVCADFIANINYHRNRPNEKALLYSLEQQKRFFSFEAFGGHSERRARIAERNKDFVLAAFRWILIAISTQQSDQKVQEILTRLILKIINTSGRSGAYISFEALIEKIWDRFGRKQKFIEALAAFDLIELTLKSIDVSEIKFNLSPTLYRIRNLKLLSANHLGHANAAENIIDLQNQGSRELSSNPEYFHRVLEFKVIEIEYQVNLLLLDVAYKKAIDFSNSIEHYREVWQLLDENTHASEFNRSNIWIISEMVLLRASALVANTLDENQHNELMKKFDALKNLVKNRVDESRLKNYYLLYLLKLGKFNQAFELAKEDFALIKDSTNFDLFLLLNVVNSMRLKHSLVMDKTFLKSLEVRLAKEDLLTLGHPNDLIWREAALFYWLKGDKSLALNSIGKAQKQFNLQESPVSTLLRNMMKLYEDFFNDKFSGSTKYTSGLPFSLSNNLSVEDTLVEMRRLSPY